MNLYDITPKDLAENYNSFSLMVMSERIKICANVMDNFSSASIQRIVNWDGERNTDYCTDYCGSIFKIINTWSSWDSGSSSTQHETAQFVSDFIVALAKEKLTEVIRLKREQMEGLLKEAEKLRLELDTL